MAGDPRWQRMDDMSLTENKRACDGVKMRMVSGSQWGRRTVAALYALAVLLVGFASSNHSAPIHAAPRHAEAHIAWTAPTIGCHGEAEHGGAPSRSHNSCCDACTLTVAPGLGVFSIFHFVRRLEISTRFAFAPRLGRDLDGAPTDLRSRAPPSLA
jgi:hypothetical protein